MAEWSIINPLAALTTHCPADPAEAASLTRIRHFLELHPDRPYDRANAQGHITGSAFILDTEGLHVFLIHHAKLQRWLQPGGHGDAGDPDAAAIALREATEETGIDGLHLHLTAPRPFDVDVHIFPARGNEPAHDHLDLRFALVAPPTAQFTADERETTGARWFAWDELAVLDLDPGTRRALTKLRALVPGTAAPA